MHCSTHVITSKATLMQYTGKQRSGHKEEKERSLRMRGGKIHLELNGKIFCSLKIMRNQAGNKHMLGTGGGDMKKA